MDNKTQKWANHQNTKQERLEELRNKLSEYEINSAFRYAAICNSVFGKRRIKSRQRIILTKMRQTEQK